MADPSEDRMPASSRVPAPRPSPPAATRPVSPGRRRFRLRLALAGWLALGLGPGAAPTAEASEPLGITLTTDRDRVGAGDVLRVSVQVDNAGLPGVVADFYLGAVLPDGGTLVTFGADLVPSVGSFGGLAALPPLAPGVSLASPFDAPRQAVIEYLWTGSEPVGEYRFFAAAIRAGGLADGRLDEADLLGLSTRTVRLGPGSTSVRDWHAFADSRVVESAAQALNLLRGRQPQVCVPGQPGPELTLGDALVRIRSRIEAEAGVSALDAFVAGLDDPARAVLTAAAAVAGRKPHAALAAFLSAHLAEPTHPGHLINAAGLASLLDLTAEALSLLDAAELAGGPPGAPLGLDGRALALNNRGHALLGQGRYAEAAGALEEAAVLAPQLAEARSNLSVALLCQDGDGAEERAVRLFRSSRWRTPGPAVRVDAPAPVATPQTHPTVTLKATLGTAAEDPPTPGVLTVHRTGDPSAPLTVAYQVGGTATPDADYAALPGSLTIPSGAFSAVIPVTPVPDDVEDPDETVVVTLVPGVGYTVGAAASDTITIGALLLPADRVRRAFVGGPPEGPLGSFELPPVFDLSAGVEAELPSLPYPEHPNQYGAFRPIYRGLMDGFSQHLAATGARMGEILAAIQARPRPDPLTERRIYDTFAAMYTYRHEPPFDALDADFWTALRAADTISSRLHGMLTSANRTLYSQASQACGYGAGSEACRREAWDRYFCQPIRAAHPAWRAAIVRADAATRALLGPGSRHLTALAANVADPLWHERAMLEAVSDHVQGTFNVLVSQVNLHVELLYRYFDDPPYGCALAQEPVPPPEPAGALVVREPGACPPALTAAKVQLKLADVFSVSFNCETVELEVAEPGLGLFGQLSLTVRPGQRPQVTLFAGAKASVPGLGLGAKEGFYLRADSQSFTDAGFKVSMSNLVGTPLGGLKVDSPLNMEFGVAAATQYWTGE
jgi:hypothetical protein